jgi:hypothetical protein
LDFLNLITMAHAQVMEQAFTMIALQLERQVDDEINRLDNLGEADIASIRQKRMAELRKKQEKTKEWLAKGHGEYSEVLSEKEFFEAMKGEERMICHFYRENWPCKVRDMPLSYHA